MKVKTSELSGVQLDYAVATAKGLRLAIHGGEVVNITKNGDVFHHVRFTDFWSLCGPLIEEFSAHLIYMYPGCWKCSVPKFEGYGENPMTAICRTVVSAKLGDEVEIPDELMEIK